MLALEVPLTTAVQVVVAGLRTLAVPVVVVLGQTFMQGIEVATVALLNALVVAVAVAL